MGFHLSKRHSRVLTTLCGAAVKVQDQIQCNVDDAASETASFCGIRNKLLSQDDDVTHEHSKTNMTD